MSRLCVPVCFLALFVLPVAAPPAGSAEIDPFAVAACERAFDEGRFSKAVELCRPLAEDGQADAQAVMGQLHQDGRGVPRDYTEAARWYKAAAEQGHIEAQFNLGTMYRYGVGVTRNLAEAYAWLTLAADAGHADAASGRALVEKRMTPAQLDDGTRRAAELAEVVRVATQPPADESPATDATPPAGDDERTQALVDALRAVADQAERDRTADFRVIQKLRELVQSYDRPWRVSLLDDDFGDGDFTRSPVWTVDSGKFSIDSRYGLRSRFKPPAKLDLGSSDSGGDAALQLFGAVLGGLSQQQSGDKPKRAEIHTELSITNIFSVEIEFGALAKAIEGGGIEFGPYRGRHRQFGYRLVYTQGAKPSLAMVQFSRSGSSVVARANLEAGLEDGSYHRLLIRRGHDGAMEVALDGVQVMTAVDHSLPQRFAGFVLINKGGDFALRRVTILGSPQ